MVKNKYDAYSKLNQDELRTINEFGLSRFNSIVRCLIRNLSEKMSKFKDPYVYIKITERKPAQNTKPYIRFLEKRLTLLEDDPSDVIKTTNINNAVIGDHCESIDSHDTLSIKVKKEKKTITKERKENTETQALLGDLKQKEQNLNYLNETTTFEVIGLEKIAKDIVIDVDVSDEQDVFTENRELKDKIKVLESNVDVLCNICENQREMILDLKEYLSEKSNILRSCIDAYHLYDSHVSFFDNMSSIHERYKDDYTKKEIKIVEVKKEEEEVDWIKMNEAFIEEENKMKKKVMDDLTQEEIYALIKSDKFRYINHKSELSGSIYKEPRFKDVHTQMIPEVRAWGELKYKEKETQTAIDFIFTSNSIIKNVEVRNNSTQTIISFNEDDDVIKAESDDDYVDFENDYD